MMENRLPKYLCLREAFEGGIFYDMDIPGGCLYVLISGQELLIRYDVSGLIEDIIPSPGR